MNCSNDLKGRASHLKKINSNSFQEMVAVPPPIRREFSFKKAIAVAQEKDLD